MFSLLSLTLALLAGSFHQATAAPTPSSNLASVGQTCGKFFSGPASNFPAQDTWLDFVTLFNRNKQNMLNTGDVGEDVGRIFNAINDAAAAIGVEERVILAIILQESGGDVGVICTPPPNGSDCGLMQADGSPGFPGRHSLSQVFIHEIMRV